MTDGGAGGARAPWLERAGSVAKLIRGLAAACAIVVLADAFYEKHGHYGFERVFGFHALYGFVSCVALVLTAAQLRKLLMRDERYYGPVDDQFENPDGDPLP